MPSSSDLENQILGFPPEQDEWINSSYRTKPSSRLDYQANRPREPKPPPPRAPPSRLWNPAATRSRRPKPPSSRGPSYRPEIPDATGRRRPWNEVVALGTAAVRRKIPAAPGTAVAQTQGPRRHLHQGHKPVSWLPLAAAEERERGGNAAAAVLGFPPSRQGGGDARVIELV
uniref:Uncharacterized protein 259I16.7 n=1 Tax=Hordeum vulgare subsp. vulgare TaxID=112509 RepID=Q8SA47_HORVV|nr:hypothetical protein [Hordeum vulgare subsp. vulgare]